ncbi:poly(rC)-binding protein 3 isoform X1 [Frankliniella occidentalis]|uniref:Poly(RC)-binding protein 3 isoform X1 n=2 Tax=Frankliniella occidentalis TaxID=133901 RepID=A0A9C6TUW2_FRAOC|nr:poly(rC)-binding protein 3 isoform X1 [Frankliniella occidentalis]
MSSCGVQTYLEVNQAVMEMDQMISDENVTLTIRLIMLGKEVGSIIGKKGEIVKRFREESGAKINISDGSCPERIVTVTGATKAIFKAFTLISKKMEEFHEMQSPNGGAPATPRAPITLRLIVPASQCGSLIGKGGSKIKEIREVTGASIQVASDMLPNSTERAVTITGTGDAVTQCIYHICMVMLESPPKGATIPYRPKPQVAGPVILAGGQAYTIQGNYAVPTHGDVSSSSTLYQHPAAPPLGLFAPAPMPPQLLPHPHSGLMDPLLKNGHLAAALPPAHLAAACDMGKMGSSPLAGLAALGLGGLNPAAPGGINPAAALAALAGSQLRSNHPTRQQGGANPPAQAGNGAPPQTGTQTHEMTVPNELIGCIIGKGGTKIAEIRQISGAMIRISNCEEREGGATDRTITITGNPDAVALAQYLINMSVELQKANLEAQNSSTPGNNNPGSNSSGPANSNSPLASAIPLAQLLAKPGALNALSSLSALGGLSELLGGLSGSSPVQTTGVHRQHNKTYQPRMRSPGGTGSENKGRSERSKFAPY